MPQHERYPVLEIDTQAIYSNAKAIVQLCKEQGIDVAGVFKGVNGIAGIGAVLEDAGCHQIASSRIDQLAAYKRLSPQTQTMLLRLPMASEVPFLPLGVDISLNSERSTLQLIDGVFRCENRLHRVVLMMDLGDLREGFFDEEELIETALWVEWELEHVELEGIGVNLGCYGSIKPTEENLSHLVDIARRIEAKIERKLNIVSGGATSSLPLVYDGKMPQGINHLRIGEGILLNMDLPVYWDVMHPALTDDTMRLKAQIIEIKNKPSMPIGEIFIDAFGHTPIYIDKGTRKRALIGLGKQDFAMEDKLLPMTQGMSIIGSSSDHLIVDLTECSEDFKVGDVVAFRIFYGPMLHLCTQQGVEKKLL